MDLFRPALRVAFSGMIVLLVASQVAVNLAATAVAQESPGETIEGDPQAWNEIKSAYEKLTRLKSYRAIHPGDPSMVEVINPDRFHYIFNAGFMAIEFVSVGSDYAERTGTGGQRGSWRCFSGRSNLASLEKLLPPMLLLTMRKQPRVESVKVSRLGETVIRRQDGEVLGKTQGYEYAVTLAGRPPFIERLFILPETGLPRRTEVLDAAGKVLRSLGPSVDYQDYDAPFIIMLPRC